MQRRGCWSSRTVLFTTYFRIQSISSRKAQFREGASFWIPSRLPLHYVFQFGNNTLDYRYRKRDLDFAHTDVDTFVDTVNTNLRSVFLAGQAAVKHMAAQGSGSIINISSIGGLVPDISQVAYGTSKAAINYLTKLIAVHEAKHGIRCNAVLPGMTATEAVEKHLTEEFRSLFLRHIPLSRMGLPNEIASAVVYLASDESSYTTGQLLAVAGGFGLATPVYGALSEKHKEQ